jgi:hypothetical protein
MKTTTLGLALAALLVSTAATAEGSFTFDGPLQACADPADLDSAGGTCVTFPAATPLYTLQRMGTDNSMEWLECVSTQPDAATCYWIEVTVERPQD